MARFDAFGLIVDDMAATVGFYRRLGLDIPAGSEHEGHVEVEVAGLRMMFDSAEIVRSFSEWEPPSGGGRRIALAFLCESPDDVDATFADLTGAGYRGHVEPFDAFWGQRYATILDPDGNPVDLFAPLE